MGGRGAEPARPWPHITRGDVGFTFEEAARIAQPNSEWYGHGFEERPFDLHVRGIEEALGLRPCWVPCPMFASFTTDAAWAERRDETRHRRR